MDAKAHWQSIERIGELGRALDATVQEYLRVARVKDTADRRLRYESRIRQIHGEVDRLVARMALATVQDDPLTHPVQQDHGTTLVAKMAGLTQRLNDLHKAHEGALGVNVDYQNVHAFVQTISERLRASGNTVLADSYRGAWERYFMAVCAVRDAVLDGAPRHGQDSLMDAADSAGKAYEHVWVDVTAWLVSTD